jgi:hypothetical protein
MSEFEEIESMKVGVEKNTRLKDFYKEKVKIDEWLINTSKNSIINFKDRTEYKKNNIYHRINGPAIDYKNEELDKYYYKGKLLKKEEWSKITTKEVRKIKIKKLNIENEKSSE